MLHRFILITLFAFSVTISCAQTNRIENLVFEGAGIRGLAYSGAIRVLEEKQILNSVERVCGTSAGAITALLISIGYGSDEITNIVNNTPFKKFNDGRFFFIGGFNRLQKFYGWYRGVQFEKWLEKIIKTKTGNADISFEQLKQQGFKELYVTGTCLNQQKLIIFSHENYPSMKIKDALRISMSIPLYFEAVFINKNGQIIKHPTNKEGLDIMIDGGVTGNFPIRVFDSSKYFLPSIPNVFQTNPYTLGFRIDRKEQMINDAEGKGLAPIPVNNIKDYLSAFYNIVIENLNRQELTAGDWQRTISINDGEIAPRIRKLSEHEIQTLVTNGARATENFLFKYLR